MFKPPGEQVVFIVLLVAALAPLVAAALSRHVDEARYLALLTALGLIVVAWDALVCNVTTLEEWFWFNCGLGPLERLEVAMSTVPALASSAAFALSLVAVKLKRRDLMVMASTLLFSIFFVKFSTLGVKGLLLMPFKAVPLGYGVYRAWPAMGLRPLEAASAALLLAYLITKYKPALYATIIMMSIYMPFVMFYNLAAYGVALPLSAYHLSLVMLMLSGIAILHRFDKLVTLASALSVVSAEALPRLTRLSYGGLAPVYMHYQYPVALAWVALAAYTLLKSLKLDMEGVKAFDVLALICLAGFVYSVYSLAVSALFKQQTANELVPYALAVLASLFLSSKLLIQKEKIGTIGPISLIHPLFGLISSIALSIYELVKKGIGEALMTFSALALALALLYATPASTVTPFASVKYVSLKNVTIRALPHVKIFKYESNLTAFVRTLVIKYPHGTQKAYEYVGVYVGKYELPISPAYSIWLEPKWKGLCTCSIVFRFTPENNRKGEAAIYCIPLTAFAFPAFAAPGLTAIYYALTKRKGDELAFGGNRPQGAREVGGEGSGLEHGSLQPFGKSDRGKESKRDEEQG